MPAAAPFMLKIALLISCFLGLSNGTRSALVGVGRGLGAVQLFIVAWKCSATSSHTTDRRLRALP
jgi:hypothetical protein